MTMLTGQQHMDIRYPDIEVQLSGEDGNAFAILGLVRRELRRAGVSEDDCAAFTAEATSGDYDHLLQTVMKTVNVA